MFHEFSLHRFHFNQYSKNTKHVERRMVATNGEDVPTIGIGEFTFSGKQFHCPAAVASTTAHVIVGVDFMQVVVDPSDRPKTALIARKGPFPLRVYRLSSAIL